MIGEKKKTIFVFKKSWNLNQNKNKNGPTLPYIALFQPVRTEPRPKSSKPKNPDEIEFQDESVAKDYRKMFDKIREMEAMLVESKKAEMEAALHKRAKDQVDEELSED